MQEKKRNNAIDIIRGIAILMVFLHHFGQSLETPFAITSFGQMGCQLFFAVSGFTCSYSYAKSGSAKEFYRKRLKSLLPSFYTVLAIVVVSNVICVHAFDRFLVCENIGPVSVLCNFLLLHGLLPFCNNNVFPGGWFIGTIVILYLLHPVFETIYRKIEKHWLAALGTTSAMLAMTVCINWLMNGTWVVTNNSFVYFLFTNQAGCYLLGMLMNKEMKRCKEMDRKACLGLFLVALGISLGLFYGGFGVGFLLAPTMVGAATCFFYLLIQDVDFKGKAVDALCHAGKDSFSIYATHWLPAWKFSRTGMRFLMRLGISDMRVSFLIQLVPLLVVSLALAWALQIVLDQEKKLWKL